MPGGLLRCPFDGDTIAFEPPHRLFAVNGHHLAPQKIPVLIIMQCVITIKVRVAAAAVQDLIRQQIGEVLVVLARADGIFQLLGVSRRIE